MYEVMERISAAASETPQSADAVRWQVLQGLDELTPELQEQLGIAATPLMEVPVRGPHRLLVMDTTTLPGRTFKYGGASFAVHRTLQRDPGVETFVAGTAGNFGGALAAAAQASERKAVLYTPANLTDAKRRNMVDHGGAVVAEAADVQTAIAQAHQHVAGDNAARFMHPYDDMDAIAGQALFGTRIAQGLQDLAVSDPVRVCVQRGGGSLMAGVASVLRDVPGVRVQEVRPDRVEGVLDPRYDGLAVETPGVFAKAVLDDPAYVDGTYSVSEADTGRAALLLHKELGGRQFEPSGYAGVAACLKQMSETTEPTTFVAILSGANAVEGSFADFTVEASRRAQQRVLAQIALTNEGSLVRLLDRRGSALAAHRLGTSICNGAVLRETI